MTSPGISRSPGSASPESRLEQRLAHLNTLAHETADSLRARCDGIKADFNASFTAAEVDARLPARLAALLAAEAATPKLTKRALREQTMVCRAWGIELSTLQRDFRGNVAEKFFRKLRRFAAKVDYATGLRLLDEARAARLGGQAIGESWKGINRKRNRAPWDITRAMQRSGLFEGGEDEQEDDAQIDHAHSHHSQDSRAPLDEAEGQAGQHEQPTTPQPCSIYAPNSKRRRLRYQSASSHDSSFAAPGLGPPADDPFATHPPLPDPSSRGRHWLRRPRAVAPHAAATPESPLPGAASLTGPSPSPELPRRDPGLLDLSEADPDDLYLAAFDPTEFMSDISTASSDSGRVASGWTDGIQPHQERSAGQFTQALEEGEGASAFQGGCQSRAGESATDGARNGEPRNGPLDVDGGKDKSRDGPLDVDGGKDKSRDGEELEARSRDSETRSPGGSEDGEDDTDCLEPGIWLRDTVFNRILKTIALLRPSWRFVDSLLVTSEVATQKTLQMPPGTDMVFGLHLVDHWVLVMLICDSREAHIYDAKQSPYYYTKACNLLHSFFNKFLHDKRWEEWVPLACACPLQENSSDCGVYALITACRLAAGLTLPQRTDGLLWRQLFKCLFSRSATAFAPSTDEEADGVTFNFDRPVPPKPATGSVPAEELVSAVTANMNYLEQMLEASQQAVRTKLGEVSLRMSHVACAKSTAAALETRAVQALGSLRARQAALEAAIGEHQSVLGQMQRLAPTATAAQNEFAQHKAPLRCELRGLVGSRRQLESLVDGLARLRPAVDRHAERLAEARGRLLVQMDRLVRESGKSSRLTIDKGV